MDLLPGAKDVESDDDLMHTACEEPYGGGGGGGGGGRDNDGALDELRATVRDLETRVDAAEAKADVVLKVVAAYAVVSFVFGFIRRRRG